MTIENRKIRDRVSNHGATIMGVAVAVANAWVTIDFENFVFNTGNAMKLTISAVIAIGGYMSRIKVTDKNGIENN
jgi:hypothetical protein